jgi:hypothetical protein
MPPRLSDGGFNTELHEVARAAQRYLAEGGKTSFPAILTAITWNAAAGRRERMLIGLVFPDGRKYESLEKLGRRLASDGIDVMAIYLSSEAWMREPRETPGGLAYGRITGEAVTIAGATGDGRRNLCILAVERGRDRVMRFGRVEPLIQEFDPASPARVEGDLLSAFWAGYRAPPQAAGRGCPSGN